ncbi:MAG: insulinase family protein [Candidatus Schekmanbacteria bacterium]|nr:insulinase family protein [Candidatus Schekmanbacteria bacterium]
MQKLNIRKYIIGLILLIWLVPNNVHALQKAERTVLDNGMVLLLLEQHALPIVTVEVSLKAGGVYDPPAKEGLANITANLLSRGTKQFSAQGLAQAIEFVGGDISSSADTDFAEINLTILSKDLDLGFKLMGEVIAQPTFPQEEMEKEQKEIVGDIIQEKEDPSAVAGKRFNKILYGTHPYNHPEEGWEESVPNLTRQDVLDFYQKYYRPNNAVMVVVGDITKSQLDELLKKYLSAWEKRDLSLPVIPEAQPLPAKTVELIDQELTQATVLLGHKGISRSHPDYYQLYVMNYIMGGGGFSSRLLANIRDEKGLAYSAASYFYPLFYGGAFQATIQTKNENTPQVIEATLSEIKRMRTTPVSAEELESAKSFITGSFPLKLDTNSKIAGYLAYMENFGLGLDYFEKFPQYINAVTAGQILQVAQKYLEPENYLLVVVGNQGKTGLKSGK